MVEYCFPFFIVNHCSEGICSISLVSKGKSLSIFPPNFLTNDSISLTLSLISGGIYSGLKVNSGKVIYLLFKILPLYFSLSP